MGGEWRETEMHDICSHYKNKNCVWSDFSDITRILIGSYQPRCPMFMSFMHIHLVTYLKL